jgi:DnaK suppressor protein
MTREEIAAKLGIVVNSVRGKVQRGQIERKVEDGKNWYRIVDPDLKHKTTQHAPPPSQAAKQHLGAGKKSVKKESTVFNPKQVLLEQLASIKIGTSIQAIEKGDEIDLAAGEISRELDAKITMRQHKQAKEIEEALERIKYGEYGSCEECGETIPEQRLRLFPAARYCVRCQEEADRYEKIKTYRSTKDSGSDNY